MNLLSQKYSHDDSFLCQSWIKKYWKTPPNNSNNWFDDDNISNYFSLENLSQWKAKYGETTSGSGVVTETKVNYDLSNSNTCSSYCPSQDDIENLNYNTANNIKNEEKCITNKFTTNQYAQLIESCKINVSLKDQISYFKLRQKNTHPSCPNYNYISSTLRVLDSINHEQQSSAMLSVISDLDVNLTNPITLTIPRSHIHYSRKITPQANIENRLDEINALCFIAELNVLLTTDTNGSQIRVRKFPCGSILFSFTVKTMDHYNCYPVSIDVCPIVRKNFFFKQTTDVTGQLGCLWKLPELLVGVRKPHNRVLRLNSDLQSTMCEYGRGYIQHLKTSSVDHDGNIFILENKIMRISLFDYVTGTMIASFVSYDLEFPIDFIIDFHYRIIVANNRRNCLNVFDYSGMTMGNKIGGTCLTNHCGAVVLAPNGHVIVLDNHNSFNITIFNWQGYLLHAFCGKTKHAQILSAIFVPPNYVAFSSRDYNMFIYEIPMNFYEDITVDVTMSLASPANLSTSFSPGNVKSNFEFSKNIFNDTNNIWACSPSEFVK